MRGRSANETAEADDAVVPIGARHLLGGLRQLEGSRHSHDGDVRIRRSMAHECVERALDEAIDDEAVETRGDDYELLARAE